MFLLTPCSSHGNDSICTACPAGTFLSQPNTLTKCQACYECDHQSELALCCAMLYGAMPCPSLPACFLQPSRAC